MHVTGGEKISVAPPRPPDAAPRAQRMPLKIVHEDTALIVIDKPRAWWCIRARASPIAR